jgi:hypothetical protein
MPDGAVAARRGRMRFDRMDKYEDTMKISPFVRRTGILSRLRVHEKRERVPV